MRNSTDIFTRCRRGRADWLSRCWLACGLALTTILFLRATPASTSERAAPQASASAESPSSLITRAIEDLAPGDLVLAKDDRTGTLAPAPVARTFQHTSDHLRVLRIASPHGTVQEIRTTDEHPFWVASRGWVKAGELTVEDRLVQTDGLLGSVIATRHEPHPEGIRVFNLEVAGYHTYFVAAAGSRAPPVWVHNKVPDDIPPIIYRKGDGSPSSLRPRPGIDDDGISFWAPLGNPIEPGRPGPWGGTRPVFGPGDRFIGLDTSKLPDGSVRPFGDHPNHWGVDPTTPLEKLKKAIVDRGRFPKDPEL